MSGNHIKGVTFDLDGTILDSIGPSVEWIRAAINQTLGHALSDQQITDQFGQPEPRILAALCPAQGEVAFANFQKILREGLARVTMFEGMQEILEQLSSQDVPRAVYTTRGRWATDMMIQRFSLEKYFPIILAGEEVSRLKPDPEGILKLARNLNLQPTELIYVGDSLSDLQAASKAGCRPLQALWGKETIPHTQYAGLKTPKDLKRHLAFGAG